MTTIELFSVSGVAIFCRVELLSQWGLSVVLRDLLNRFRKRTPSTWRALSLDELRKLYEILKSLRVLLVESFDELKDRRLREVYDYFSYMMLHYDKLCQFLRRVVGAPLYDDNRLSIARVKQEISALPPELAVKVRNLATYISMLRDYAASAPPSSIRSIIMDINSLIDDIAGDIGSYLR